VLADLRRHYEEAATAETRTRYHMVLLAKPGQRVPQIARLVARSEDTVARVLKRFLTQGLQAVPRQSTAESARAHRDGRLGNREARVLLNWTRHAGGPGDGELDDPTPGSLPGRENRDQGVARDSTNFSACGFAMCVNVPPGPSSAKPKRKPMT
jgi:hypothetical protein